MAPALRVAIAGFGPFPGVPRNPSAEIVRAIARKRRYPAAGVLLDSAIFPTAYRESEAALKALLAHRPQAVVLFGVAARTKHIRIERFARNTASMLYPDHARYKPDRRALVAGGDPRLKSRAPFLKLLAAARTGYDAAPSINAGRYLCNAVFYRALAETASWTPPPLVQFVHVPQPKSMRELASMTRACEAVVWAAALEAARLVPRAGSGRLTRPGS